ncbi:hypothetical protein PENSPDRAFT_739566 [Peniophora sp. CONT]|nr:hypothetical protein PENSPDRAFT_739566 [Peniophora sp. CONT]
MADPPPSSSLHTTNPDHLVAILQGFINVNTPKRRRESEGRHLKSLERRGGKILDSLAYVMVSDKDKQVVAVGAFADGKGDRMRLVVSENGRTEDKTQAHLVEILGRLRKLSLAYADKTGSTPLDTFVFETPDAPQFTEPESQLVALEGLILHYAWKKNAQRFWKRSQHLEFIEVAADVLGKPASERVGERTPTELGLLRTLQSGLLTLRQSIDKTRGECDLADRIRRGWADDNTTVPDNALLGKAPDVLRWLSKSTALCDHFLRIASVAKSSALTYMFLSEQTPPLFLANPRPNAAIISISRQDVRQVLEAVQVEDDNGEIEEFLRNMGFKAGDQLELAVGGPIHCECNVLAALCTGERPVHYIGVSKLSCAVCDAYFAVIRAVTDEPFHTKGSHDQTTNWSCPTITNLSLDALVREEFYKRLLKKLKEGWSTYNEVRRASQSTDVSHISVKVKGSLSLTAPDDLELDQVSAKDDDLGGRDRGNNDSGRITSHTRGTCGDGIRGVRGRGNSGEPSRGDGLRVGRGRGSSNGDSAATANSPSSAAGPGSTTPYADALRKRRS